MWVSDKTLLSRQTQFYTNPFWRLLNIEEFVIFDLCYVHKKADIRLVVMQSFRLEKCISQLYRWCFDTYLVKCKYQGESRALFKCKRFIKYFRLFTLIQDIYLLRKMMQKCQHLIFVAYLNFSIAPWHSTTVLSG